MLDQVISTAEQKMQKSLETLKKDLMKIRTGRAHTSVLDNVMVDYYGSMMPINQVANINVSDASTLSIQPYEKTMSAKIEKAIRESDLGLNPTSQGDVLRISIPPLTEERRRELIKLARSDSENSKVAVRQIRREANEFLKKQLKDKLISEDDEWRAQESIQKSTDKAINDIDKLLQAKEADLLSL